MNFSKNSSASKLTLKKDPLKVKSLLPYHSYELLLYRSVGPRSGGLAILLYNELYYRKDSETTTDLASQILNILCQYAYFFEVLVPLISPFSSIRLIWSFSF